MHQTMAQNSIRENNNSMIRDANNTQVEQIKNLTIPEDVLQVDELQSLQIPQEYDWNSGSKSKWLHFIAYSFQSKVLSTSSKIYGACY